MKARPKANKPRALRRPAARRGLVWGALAAAACAVPAALSQQTGLAPVGVESAGTLGGPSGSGAVSGSAAPKAPTMTMGGVTLTLPVSGEAPAAKGKTPEAAPTARAQWKTTFKPFAAVSVTGSDNANLASGAARKKDATLTGSVGAALSVESARARGGLSYAAGYDHDFNGTNAGALRHDLSAAGGGVLIPGLLYLDGAAGISQSGEGRTSLNPAAGRDGREMVYYGSLTPSLRRNLGGWANAELRYTHQRGFNGAPGAPDEWTHAFSASLSSDPRRFSAFGWGVNGGHTIYGATDGRDRSSWTTGVSVDVPISGRLAVTGAAGYDIHEDTTLEKAGGAYANAGLRFAPNPRMTASAYGGWRNKGVDFGGQVSYRLGERATGSAVLGRSVEYTDFGGAPYALMSMGAAADGSPLYRSKHGGATGNPAEALAIDLADGTVRAADDPAFSRRRADSISDTLTLALAGATGKTSYSLAGAAARRDYGGPFGVETGLSVSGALSRSVTSRLSFDASGALQYDQSAEAGASDRKTLSMGLGAAWRITEIVNAFARYTYTQRFSDSADDAYRENAATIGLRAQF